jgi:protein arginine N-methyltransferase 1
LWSTDLDEHRRYLSDQVRMDAFERAIREVVCTGDVVLDIGTGTGILGLLACRAGAGRVFSVDRAPIIELARRVYRTNGFEERVVFFKGISTQLNLPEKVDVVLADQLDGAGFEAGLVNYFADAKTRFLKPGGRMIPASVKFQIAAVQCNEHWQAIAFWGREHAGMDFSPASEIATNVAYGLEPSAVTLLSEEATGQSIDFARDIPDKLDMTVALTVKRPGTFHGLLCWFSARLSENVTLTNSPSSDRRAERRCTFLPIREPVAVAAGDSVRCVVKAPMGQNLVHWSVSIESKNNGAEQSDVAQFVHSTFKGALLCPEDMRRTVPSYVPTLTPTGQAVLAALKLVEEEHTVEVIAEQLHADHPCMFRSVEEASVFVAGVIGKHAQ